MKSPYCLYWFVSLEKINISISDFEDDLGMGLYDLGMCGDRLSPGHMYAFMT
jgi:hypothetical protein